MGGRSKGLRGRGRCRLLTRVKARLSKPDVGTTEELRIRKGIFKSKQKGGGNRRRVSQRNAILWNTSYTSQLRTLKHVVLHQPNIIGVDDLERWESPLSSSQPSTSFPLYHPMSMQTHLLLTDFPNHLAISHLVIDAHVVSISCALFVGLTYHACGISGFGEISKKSEGVNYESKELSKGDS